MYSKIKHLEMIQAIVSRMAANSFRLKSWSVTLVAGFLAITIKEMNAITLILACMILMVFWGLDSYYLQQERLYRAFYEGVCANHDIKNYSMRLDITKLKMQKPCCFFIRCMLSKTECLFYGILLAVIVFFLIVFFCL